MNAMDVFAMVVVGCVVGYALAEMLDVKREKRADDISRARRRRAQRKAG